LWTPELNECINAENRSLQKKLVDKKMLNEDCTRALRETASRLNRQQQFLAEYLVVHKNLQQRVETFDEQLPKLGSAEQTENEIEVVMNGVGLAKKELRKLAIENEKLSNTKV
jgi:hypothetical protein